jgi:hypothetical protein
MISEKLLKSLLTGFEFSEGNGVVEVNAVDGLLAIAAAINRLASAHEKSNAREDMMVQHIRDTVQIVSDDGPGHA